MIVSSVILAAIVAVYAYLVIRCSWVFGRPYAKAPQDEAADKNHPDDKAPLPATDLIVAAKNEQQNIARLAQSVLAQTHRQCRLIFVDDHSTDDTYTLAQSLLTAPHTVLHSSGHGKKEALQCGMAESTAGYILLTDADCFPEEHWAELMVSAAVDSDAEMVMAPIIIEPIDRGSMFQRLQMAESFALITITAGTCLDGSPVMCNGGNIGYRAQFLKANKQGMNARYASGDDMFMMETASRQRRSFAYVRDPRAAIRTAGVATLGQLINQRARWVSKTGGYTSWYILFFAFAILLGNLAMIAAPILYMCRLLPWWALTGMCLLKFAADFCSVRVSSEHYGEHQRFLDVLVMEIIYPYYVVVSCVSSLVRGFKWK